jgi:hypothetical protein
VNQARQAGLSLAFWRAMQAATRASSGISSGQRRKASSSHACSCCARTSDRQRAGVVMKNDMTTRKKAAFICIPLGPYLSSYARQIGWRGNIALNTIRPIKSSKETVVCQEFMNRVSTKPRFHVRAGGRTSGDISPPRPFDFKPKVFLICPSSRMLTPDIGQGRPAWSRRPGRRLTSWFAVPRLAYPSTP